MTSTDRIGDELRRQDCNPRAVSWVREQLGLSCLELADALELTGPAHRRREYVEQMEHGSRTISGPIRVALRAMLAGFAP